ncbi:MAG: septal ring lytic transglycosylase RlpA family protein [Rickettsiales bacterium]|nr:septal ring lytic transglycosylase RlpA family protein [Rickettsiales bacterium]
MKNLCLLIIASILLFSCSELTLEPIVKKTRYVLRNRDGSIIKDSGAIIEEEKKYENQDGYFDDLFNRDGNYRGYYKIGKPYKIGKTNYTPKNYESYEESGMASWYGTDFHGKKTANGEIFNAKSVTAAHRTLPLPSMVRITNLKNGKMVMARVNDRGPFSKARIIDVSEEAASLLDFKRQGTAKVKVEFLPDETDELLKQLNIKQND